MKLPELHCGRLLRRYKRFLADIETPSGPMTIHCPNTGAMTGCAEPGSTVWYSLSDNPKRKYPATWELVETAGGLCSVNTGRANKLVHESLTEGLLSSLAADARIQPEAAIPQGGGRFDFALHTQPISYVEVKSVTLYQGRGAGAFPDAVSTRASKHVQALQAQVAAGHRAILVFCAQHCGIEQVRPASQIDPLYAEQLGRAQAAGVEVLAVGCSTDLQSMQIDRQLEFRLA